MNKNSTKKVNCPKCNKEIESKNISIHLDSHPSEIVDWLYLGSYSNASDKISLESLNIKYILNCASECKNLFENDKEFEYLKLDIKDSNDFNIDEYFEKGIEFIKTAKENKEKGNLFIHCQQGKSRSSAILISYLIKEEKYTTDEAYKYLKKKRRMIMPNLGFMFKLRAFEKKTLTDK